MRWEGRAISTNIIQLSQPIYATFTYTHVDQEPDLGTLIDCLYIPYNGVWIDMGGSGRWVFQGGKKSDTATRSNYLDVDSYMTNHQRAAATQLVRAVVGRGGGFALNVQSDNNFLEEFLLSLSVG